MGMATIYTEKSQTTTAELRAQIDEAIRLDIGQSGLRGGAFKLFMKALGTVAPHDSKGPERLILDGLLEGHGGMSMPGGITKKRLADSMTTLAEALKAGSTEDMSYVDWDRIAARVTLDLFDALDTARAEGVPTRRM